MTKTKAMVVEAPLAVAKDTVSDTPSITQTLVKLRREIPTAKTPLEEIEDMLRTTAKQIADLEGVSANMLHWRMGELLRRLAEIGSTFTSSVTVAHDWGKINGVDATTITRAMNIRAVHETEGDASKYSVNKSLAMWKKKSQDDAAEERKRNPKKIDCLKKLTHIGKMLEELIGLLPVNSTTVEEWRDIQKIAAEEEDLIAKVGLFAEESEEKWNVKMQKAQADYAKKDREAFDAIAARMLKDRGITIPWADYHGGFVEMMNSYGEVCPALLEDVCQMYDESDFNFDEETKTFIDPVENESDEDQSIPAAK